jgi:hypothetical protein
MPSKYLDREIMRVFVPLDPVPLLDLCRERIRLGKVVERVDDDDEGWLSGGGGSDFREHVDGDKGPLGSRSSS